MKLSLKKLSNSSPKTIKILSNVKFNKTKTENFLHFKLVKVFEMLNCKQHFSTVKFCANNSVLLF